MRAFVSVDLPEALHGPIADLQSAIAEASGIDPTDATQAHLTLKFLGDVEDGAVDGIVEALEAAVGATGIDPFEATFEGVGAFPDPGYIRVVWLGVGEGSDELVRLHEAVDVGLAELGFEPEGRDYAPHVTLARMRHAGGKERVQRFLEESADVVVGSMRVAEIRLTESRLRPDGPRYSTVASVPL